MYLCVMYARDSQRCSPGQSQGFHRMYMYIDTIILFMHDTTKSLHVTVVGTVSDRLRT